MSELMDAYSERIAEVETYLDFLAILERQAQNGPPKIEGAETSITAQQQKILYSSVYLQLYNLVESTMTRCIDAIINATKTGDLWTPADLCDSLQKEWVRFIARTHIDLTPDNRLTSALELCQRLVESLPVSNFKIEKGGGNWDDVEIEAISKRLGFTLDVSRNVYSAVKRPIRNDLGPLGLVKALRNDLAHGSISFAECAEDTTVTELIELKNTTCNYLREVIEQIEMFIVRFEFLIPDKRPVV